MPRVKRPHTYPDGAIKTPLALDQGTIDRIDKLARGHPSRSAWMNSIMGDAVRDCYGHEFAGAMIAWTLLRHIRGDGPFGVGVVTGVTLDASQVPLIDDAAHASGMSKNAWIVSALRSLAWPEEYSRALDVYEFARRLR